MGWILAENWWPYQRPTFVTQLFETGVAATGQRSTGVALVYPSAIEPGPDATVTIRLYDEDSTLIAERTLPPLPAGSHLARFIEELFEDEAVKALAAEMRGTLSVQSDQPLVAVTLRATEPPKGFPEGVPFLTTFPVIPGRQDE